MAHALGATVYVNQSTSPVRSTFIKQSFRVLSKFKRPTRVYMLVTTISRRTISQQFRYSFPKVNLFNLRVFLISTTSVKGKIVK